MCTGERRPSCETRHFLQQLVVAFLFYCLITNNVIKTDDVIIIACLIYRSGQYRYRNRRYFFKNVSFLAPSILFSHFVGRLLATFVICPEWSFNLFTLRTSREGVRTIVDGLHKSTGCSNRLMISQARLLSH